MGECNVKVVVRFRPFNEREKQENVNSDLSVAFPDDVSVQVMQGGKVKNTFALDRVLTPTCTQEEVFDATAKATVQDVVNGYNGTIFAYGQTGAGKSFSMFGPDITSPARGIIPRACAFIFDYIRDQASNDVEVTIKCSFLEIYKETIRDLLNPASNNLKVRETPSRGVWVDDLTEQYVTNDREVIALLQLGEKFRSVSATQMNAVSSRSHSLFVLTLQQKGRDGSSKSGKLNLADLAGSEKVEKTGAKGDTLEEAKKINQSLSALGNCINALTQKKRGHIPYRDSKLTFLLRESLGGNSKTTLIVCCSAHKFNMEETTSSLLFAQRAKSIKNTVKVNKQRSVEELNRIIQKLSKELELLKIYCQSIEQEVLKLNPKFDLAFAKKQAMPSLAQAQAPPSPALSPSSSSNSPASSVRDDASDMSFDDAQDLNFDLSTEELTLAELQVELERLRETSSLQLREHAEEIESLKDENESFRRTITSLEEECKNEKNSTTLLRSQLQKEQAKNETEIHKLEYANKQQQIEVESLNAAKVNLENHNKSLQESIKKERELLQRSKSAVDVKTQPTTPSPVSTSLTLPIPRKPDASRPAISTQSPSLKPPPQLPLSAIVTPPGSRRTSVILPPRYSVRQAKDDAGQENEALSLEELLQQSDVDVGYIQMLSNDLEALQIELNGAQSEISVVTKQLENKDERIAQLEAELEKRAEAESTLRNTLELTVSEAAQKEADLNGKIFYLEEATKVAKQREVIRVVRPIEPKPQPITPTSFFSSLFDTAKDVPAATSLTHCFKQGFLTKQGSRIKTWKKRFAVLQGNTLFYYSPDPKKEPRGRFDLDSLCVVQEADEFTQKPLSLGIFHPLKQPFFCMAESQQDRLEWIDAFKAACTVSPMQDM